jgi:hypothetical protein
MAKRRRDVCALPESECSGAPDAASSSATCRVDGGEAARHLADTPQRRRRGIFVEPSAEIISSPIGAAYSDDVAPTELCSFLNRKATKMSALTGLFFVSFDYSSDALQEIESFFKRSHKVIVALTVQEILAEHIAKKLA